MVKIVEIDSLAKEFSRLPSIGPKSALRLTYFYVNNKPLIVNMVKALNNLMDNVDKCNICHNITSKSVNPCLYCSDPNRNKSQICIVENFQDVDSIESSGIYHGVYHVLGGVISSLNDISYDDIYINDLIHRINKEDPFEIILATSFTLEGDATAMYIKSLLKDYSNISFSRLASGLPRGANLEYIDENTLGRALSGRVSI